MPLSVPHDCDLLDPLARSPPCVGALSALRSLLRLPRLPATADWEKSGKVCKCTTDHKRSDGVANPDCTSVYQGKPHCYTEPDACPDSMASGSQKKADGTPWHYSWEACKCRCNGHTRKGWAGPDCKSMYNGKGHCYVNANNCPDGKASGSEKPHHWSLLACSNPDYKKNYKSECRTRNCVLPRPTGRGHAHFAEHISLPCALSRLCRRRGPCRTNTHGASPPI